MEIVTLFTYGILGAVLGGVFSTLLKFIINRLFGDNFLSKAINYSLLLLGLVIYIGSYNQNFQKVNRPLAYIIKQISPGVLTPQVTSMVNKQPDSSTI